MKTELELVIIIAPRNLGDKVCSAISGYGHYPSVFRGKGTAPNSVLSALGVGEPEKDMIFCFAEKKNVDSIYSVLNDELEFLRKKLGIAMTVPINAVGGELTLKILAGKTDELRYDGKRAVKDKDR